MKPRGAPIADALLQKLSLDVNLVPGDWVGGRCEVGILCDWSRFEQAEDPVEWDAFRTAVHESQGWVLHRLWTPHFFRDPELSMRTVKAAVAEFLAKEPPKDDLMAGSIPG